MMPFSGRTVTVVRPASRDAYGDYSATEILTPLTDCLLAPLTPSESEQFDSDTAVDGYTVYRTSADTDVLITDKIEVDGVRYNVDGDVSTWLSVGTAFTIRRER